MEKFNKGTNGKGTRIVWLNLREYKSKECSVWQILTGINGLKEENVKLYRWRSEEKISEIEREIRKLTKRMKRCREQRRKLCIVMQKKGVEMDMAKDFMEEKRIGRFSQEMVRPILLNVGKEQMKTKMKCLKGTYIWVKTASGRCGRNAEVWLSKCNKRVKKCKLCIKITRSL